MHECSESQLAFSRVEIIASAYPLKKLTRVQSKMLTLFITRTLIFSASFHLSRSSYCDHHESKIKSSEHSAMLAKAHVQIKAGEHNALLHKTAIVLRKKCARGTQFE